MKFSGINILGQNLQARPSISRPSRKGAVGDAVAVGIICKGQPNDLTTSNRRLRCGRFELQFACHDQNGSTGSAGRVVAAISDRMRSLPWRRAAPLHIHKAFW